MKNYLSVFLSALVLCSPALANEPVMDFTKGKDQSAWQWLKQKNFIMQIDAENRDKTRLTLTDNGLELQALKPAQTMIAFKKGHVENYQDIEIIWGVNKFPAGASYAEGRRNEAIMVYAFFGKETIDSGSMIIPDSPYFIGLQLCQNDPINVPQKGRFFHEGGRFVCVAHPKEGEVVTTRYNLKKAFKEIFGKEAPPLYAVALEFDTTSPQDNGTSSAFVRSIKFPKADYIQD